MARAPVAGGVAAKTGDRTDSERRFPGVLNLCFGLLLILHVVPLWTFDYFPSQDGPTHLYNASIIRDYANVAAYREFYTLEHRYGVNWLIHLVIAGLSFALPLGTAEKVLLTGYVVLFMLAVRYAVGSIDSASIPVSFLGFPLIFNRSLHMGFYSFVFSLAVFLICIGYWVRHHDHLNRSRHIAVLAALSVLLYLTHVVSLLIAISVVGILIIWFVLTESLEQVSASSAAREVRSRGLWSLVRPKIPSLLAFAPGAILLILFLQGKQAGFPAAGRVIALARQLLSFHKLEAVVLGGLLALLALLAVLLLRDRFARMRLKRADGFLLAALFVLGLYVLTPEVLFGGSLIGERLLLIAVLLVVLWLAGQTYGPVLRGTIATGASAFAVAGLLIHVGQYQRFNDYLREYSLVADLVEPQSTILVVPFSYGERRESGWFAATAPDPLVNASGYIAGQKRLIDLANYEAVTDHFPTAFRPPLNPYVFLGAPEQPATLKLEDYQRRTGKRVHYVLLTSTASVHKELSEVPHLKRQLEEHYTIIYESPSGFAQLYRRSEAAVARASIVPTSSAQAPGLLGPRGSPVKQRGIALSASSALH